MATGHVQVSDVIVPTPFSQYTEANTKNLTAFVQSGVLVEDPVLSAFLQGGGTSETRPAWKDLDDDTVRIGDDTVSPLYTPAALPLPGKIGTFQEKFVRLKRNYHWSATQMASALAGANAFNRIGQRTGAFWARHLQFTALAILQGLFADNAAAPTGSDTHTQGDLTFDVSNLAGGNFQPGLTNFTAEALMDALQTAGDAKNMFRVLAVHSAVHNRMKKNNLIIMVRDSEAGGPFETFQGLRLVVDDGMPKTGQVYTSYIFGPGALGYGTILRDKSTEIVWRPEGGNGNGSEELWQRIEWCIHPYGHKFAGTEPSTGGGPGNGTGANQFGNAASWSRTTPERKQVPLCSLITREA